MAREAKRPAKRVRRAPRAVERELRELEERERVGGGGVDERVLAAIFDPATLRLVDERLMADESRLQGQLDRVGEVRLAIARLLGAVEGG